MPPSKKPPSLRPRTAVVMLLVIVVLGVFGGSRISMVEEITRLLPDQESHLVSLAREWGLMKKVMVVVGPAKPGAPELHRAMDAVADVRVGARGGVRGAPPRGRLSLSFEFLEPF